MANKKTARRALFSSVLALILCCCMLVGTTFAWFTDSVTSAGNKIQSGTLKIDLELLNKETNQFESIKESQKAIFDYDLWEPGYTQVEILKIENEGNLALKWYAKFTSQKELSILANVIDVYVCPSATELSMPGRDLAGYTRVGTVAEFVNTIESTTNGSLLPKGDSEGKDVAYLGIALKMQESAGNEYQNLDLGGAFDIMILATQEMYEDDSFDEKYDENADYGYYEGTGNLNGASFIEIEARIPDPVNDTKVAAIEVPVTAVVDPAEDIKLVVTRTSEPATGVTVAADQSAKHYDVSVTNIAEDNQTPIKVELRVGEGLTGIKLYHDGVEIPYDSYSGEYLIFYTTSFSPFSVVYDAVAEEKEPEDKNLPKADVDDVDELEGVPLEWTGWGGFNPSDRTQMLESVYKFTSPHDSTTVQDCLYKDWYCDYYVMFVPAEGSDMTKLPEGSITLGGNYGGYGWVGFDNPEVDVNTYIPLLGSVLGSDGESVDSYWTYANVVGLVKEFWCGVAKANGCNLDLEGCQFVVELRLTNPENLNEYKVTNSVTYTFPAAN